MDYCVNWKPDLETARKDKKVDGTPYTGKEGEFSEWAFAFAMSKFELGEKITIEQYEQAIMEGITQQALNELVTKGLIKETWDGDGIAYYPV